MSIIRIDIQTYKYIKCPPKDIYKKRRIKLVKKLFYHKPYCYCDK